MRTRRQFLRDALVGGTIISTSPSRLFQSRTRRVHVPPLIPDDAGTVAHLWVKNGAILDTKSNVWTEHSTINRNAAVSLGLADPSITAESINFTDSAYLTLGTGNDVLDFAGDFIFTCIASGNAPSGNTIFPTLYSNCNAVATNGSLFQLQGLTPNSLPVFTFGAATPSPIGLLPYMNDVNVFHVMSWGRAGNNWFAKGDALATTSGSGLSAPVPATGAQAFVGRFLNTGASWVGKMAEIRWSSTTPSVAVLDAIHAAVLT